MALTGTFKAGFSGLRTKVADLTQAVEDFRIGVGISLLNGVGSGQADKLFHDRRTLGPSATEDLDLAGVLFDLFGDAFTLARLKGIIVIADIGNVNAVRITRPATNGVPLFLAASDGIDVLPGGVFAWCSPNAGVTVTPATGDLLTFTNGGAGTNVVYEVALVGASA